MNRSLCLLHGLEAADHSLNPTSNLLVLLQQGGTVFDQRVLTLLQGPILVLELLADHDELIEAFLEALELVIESPAGIVGTHDVRL